MQHQVQSAPLCCRELRAVSEAEILYAELMLIEGLNYEFRCYHACGAIEDLLDGLTDFGTTDCRMSPRAPVDFGRHDLYRQTMELLHHSLVYSDLPFLYTPCHIAYAIVAVASWSLEEDYSLNANMTLFLESRCHSMKDLPRFCVTIQRIVRLLLVSSENRKSPETLRRVLQIRHRSKRCHWEMADFTPPRYPQRKLVRVTPTKP